MKVFLLSLFLFSTLQHEVLASGQDPVLDSEKLQLTKADHIIAEKHDGKTEPDNLAYTCARCNRFKGTDLGSFDPLTGQFTFLFNPRAQAWDEHFAFEDELIVGLTAVGRTTAKLLQMNTQERLAERQIEE